jgi:hypothetical protein
LFNAGNIPSKIGQIVTKFYRIFETLAIRQAVPLLALLPMLAAFVAAEKILAVQVG